jgi:hypothetical protein
MELIGVFLEGLRTMELTGVVGCGTESYGTDLNLVVCQLTYFALLISNSCSAN